MVMYAKLHVQFNRKFLYYSLLQLFYSIKLSFYKTIRLIILIGSCGYLDFFDTLDLN